MRDYGKIFINKSSIIHNNKYDYSLVIYKTAKDKVKIICPSHGIFEQIPDNHMNKKQGCPFCYGTFKKTQENIIKEANIIHNNKYDYSLMEYVNNRTKIKILCPIHGVFEQTTYKHISRAQGCPKCLGKNKDTKEIIEEANVIHNNKYNYQLINYVNNITKMEIICPIHGTFWQSYTKHILSKQGCPKCKESIREKIISQFLNENKILYVREKRFEDCKYKHTLPFDFYLPDYNCCIEHDGQQHFKINEHFGGSVAFEFTKIRDNIKTEYCINKNIKLFRISYFDDIEIELKNIKKELLF